MWIIPLLVLLCLSPQDAAAGALEGLHIAATTVVPALLPMMLLCRVVLSGKLPRLVPAARAAERLFGVPATALPALLTSFLGGYPLGVASVVSLYKNNRLCKRDAERAVCFCNNSGPAFFLGVVSTVTPDAGILYLIHCLAAVFCGILTAHRCNPRLRPQSAPDSPVPGFGARFSEAVGAVCQALLQITALIALCFALRGALNGLGIGTVLARFPLPQGVLTGLLELSGGILLLDGAENAFVWAAFLMGWGGLCVHLQAIALWQSAGLSPRGYFWRKLLHGLFSAALALAWQRGAGVFGVSCAVFAGSCLCRMRLREKSDWKFRRKSAILSAR